MLPKLPILALAAAFFAFSAPAPGETPAPALDSNADSIGSPLVLAPSSGQPANPCDDPELQPNSMSPTWNIQAVTVQCGALETDNLAVVQPLGNGAQQWILSATAKYGLTPRLQLRWILPGRIAQHANGTRPVLGITDQAAGALYHFHDQAAWTPDLAIDYAYKIPTANPSKAFGSGYPDHVMTFVASRDLGPNHLDFNLAGTLAGGPRGFDPALQSGLGLSHTFAHRLMATLEAFGGSQPATGDRLGAVLLGGSWGLRPSLALNAACIHSYTAGTVREQYIVGFMYTMRPGLRWRGWRSPPASAR